MRFTCDLPQGKEMIPGSDAETDEYTDNWQTVQVVLELRACVCMQGEKGENHKPFNNIGVP